VSLEPNAFGDARVFLAQRGLVRPRLRRDEVDGDLAAVAEVPGLSRMDHQSPFERAERSHDEVDLVVEPAGSIPFEGALGEGEAGAVGEGVEESDVAAPVVRELEETVSLEDIAHRHSGDMHVDLEWI